MNNILDIAIFCEKMRKLRKIKRYSKVNMAKILRIGVKTLSLIEHGSIPKNLKCNILFEIYDNFGITPMEMFSENTFSA